MLLNVIFQKKKRNKKKIISFKSKKAIKKNQKKSYKRIGKKI